MARTKADSYNKAAVKAPRKVRVLTGGQAPNIKAGSKGPKSGGNPYCPRPLPPWQIPITSFFPRDGSLGESSHSQIDDKEPEKTAVTSDVVGEDSGSVEMDGDDADPSKNVEVSCSVTEMAKIDSDDEVPSESVDAGPSKVIDEIGSENAGPSYSMERESFEIHNGPKVLAEFD